MPDGVAFVASTKEVWVTTPRDRSIVILDVKTPAAPKVAGRISLDGDPEGYAVDDSRGLFYTNLEDKDRTLRISTATRKVTATWMPSCGEEGPRGLVLTGDGAFLVVACPDHIEALAASTIATVVAVSCNPATFARDAARLISGGFRLLRVVPVDQFVWTPHLELAAVFRRMIRAADGNDRGLRARIETTTLVSERG